ncbi:MAG: sulfurtransferase [Desulfuromonadales bacterium]|nr:MAG: sulfurtransferase [Desulfuromonadales bacterium]
MTAATIKRDELNKRLAGGGVTLIDVLPGEYFEEKHIAGARNACVYEVTFLDQVRAITTDLSREIVVYGSSSRSRASAVAAEKLVNAGYRAVSDYAGGLEEWEAEGLPVEAQPDKQVPVPAMADGTYTADAGKSSVGWTGRNINGRHYGTISISSGTLSVRGGNVIAGQVVVDMATIRNLDLADDNWNRLLIRHLKSDDFFDVAHHPFATFELQSASPIPDATPGTSNYHVSGIVTIKGTGNRIEFPALMAPHADGGVTAQATIDIDRTRWGVVYGSGKLFEKLGMHLVNDIITLELQLVFG